MREIKFRAWDKEEKKMVECFGFDSQNNTIFIKCEDKTHPNCVTTDYLSDYILMQYTNFKDSSDPPKEIYEEDIIKFTAFSPKHDEEIIGIVQWYNDGCCYHVKDISEKNLYYSFGFPSMHDMSIEIIGNKCENPELLKGGK